jgi:hypothetical protein
MLGEYSEKSPTAEQRNVTSLRTLFLRCIAGLPMGFQRGFGAYNPLLPILLQFFHNALKIW